MGYRGGLRCGFPSSPDAVSKHRGRRGDEWKEYVPCERFAGRVAWIAANGEVGEDEREESLLSGTDSGECDDLQH